MTTIERAGTYALGERSVKRIGYGAMQLSEPGSSGSQTDRDAALAVLRTAVEAGVDHIDTAGFYGPHVVNELIREALSPYRDDLTIVTKVGVKRGSDGSWNPAQEPADLTQSVHENLRELGVETLDLVNLRIIDGDGASPTQASIEKRFAALAELREKGLIRQLGLSNASAKQVEEAQRIAPVACVQNHYNIARRGDDALIDELAEKGIAFVPFSFGGFKSVQSQTLSAVAERIGTSPLKLSLAWLLKRSPNILIIPGTSKVAHLQDNLSVADIELDDATMAELGTLKNGE